MNSIMAMLCECATDGLLAVDSSRLQAAPAKRDQPEPPRAVALIPVIGPLVPRSRETWFGPIEGMDKLRSRIEAAASNPEIGSILLVIDSPGGTVAGTPETGAIIRAAAERKPVVAFADTLAASAAYWLGAQATEFVATPSADVGSIGVIAAHQSYARLYERMGIDTTIFTSSEFKGEGNPYGPLSEEAKANYQARVDAADAQFVAAVASGRRVSEKRVREDFGKGRSLSAPDALAAGMIDRIATLGDVLAGMTAGKGKVFRQRRSFAFAV